MTVGELRKLLEGVADNVEVAAIPADPFAPITSVGYAEVRDLVPFYQPNHLLTFNPGKAAKAQKVLVLVL